MNNILRDTYLKIFNKEVGQKEDWEIAKEILKEWDVPKIGEEMAQQCIFQIVNHIVYPNNDITRELVGSAEEKASEIFPELKNIDPHMAVFEVLEKQYEKKKKELAEKNQEIRFR